MVTSLTLYDIGELKLYFNSKNRKKYNKFYFYWNFVDIRSSDSNNYDRVILFSLLATR